VKQRGHPVRGAIAGLLFGLSISLDLVIFGVVALDAAVLALIPLLGIVAGILLGVMAPMGRRSAQEEQPARMPSVGGSKPGPSTA
jgi:hypothetical protein